MMPFPKASFSYFLLHYLDFSTKLKFSYHHLNFSNAPRVSKESRLAQVSRLVTAQNSCCPTAVLSQSRLALHMKFSRGNRYRVSRLATMGVPAETDLQGIDYS